MPPSSTRNYSGSVTDRPRKSKNITNINTAADRIELDRWYTYKGAKIRFINVLGKPQPVTSMYSAKSVQEAHRILDELQTLLPAIKIQLKNHIK